MKYSVAYSKKAERLIEKLDIPVKNRIKKYIDDNLVGCENPRLRGKSLNGNLSDKWCYRVGNYRIVADIEDDKILITVVNVDHKKQIYSR